MLAEQIRHHVKEEETTFFPMARELFDEDELADLGRRILDLKKQHGA